MKNNLNICLFIENDTTKIEINEPIEFILNDKKYIVPIGFISDGMSIPRWFWRFIDPPVCAETLIPSVIHDFLYQTHLCSRKEADRLYLRLLIENEYNIFKCLLIYFVLRLFGASHFNKE